MAGGGCTCKFTWDEAEHSTLEVEYGIGHAPMTADVVDLEDLRRSHEVRVFRDTIVGHILQRVTILIA